MPGLNKYETEFNCKLSRITRESFIDLVDKYAPRERWIYCSFHCPVQQRCKFENRYRK